MARETTSKHIDGIADLVVIAPIKEGFINAYENITYATRLRVVAEALNKIRISAREHEFALPFSDVTERILTLLDFRIGVLDKDLFALERIRTEEKGQDDQFELAPRRFLYLTATFDTALEPYMRLIWDPLGPFLDLIFCNCEGYVTAGDHSCEEFLDWVRANQMDSAIFYATSGHTIRDDAYHGKIERLLRAAAKSKGYGAEKRELDMLHAIGPDPDADALAVRTKARDDLIKAMPDLVAKKRTPDFNTTFKLNELALEVVTVLYRLADFYPPEWLFDKDLKKPELKLTEGKYLGRVAHSILQGWDSTRLLKETREIYKEPLEWFEGANKEARDGSIATKLGRVARADPKFDSNEVQGGILEGLGSTERPVLHGALLLLTIGKAEKARAFLRQFPVHYEGDGAAADGFYRTVAFTHSGIERIGVISYTADQFPKEFREGMPARSGLIGDQRENHPRRWTLPARNWPRDQHGPTPPIDLNEIDLVIQLRFAPDPAGDPGNQPLLEEIDRIGKEAEANGLVLNGFELMARQSAGTSGYGDFTDHFGFADGISQPVVAREPVDKLFEGEGELVQPTNPGLPNPSHGIARQQTWNNRARLGEVVLGYRNNRSDFAPDTAPVPRPTGRGTPEAWRAYNKYKLRQLTKDGSFLVVRKLEQHVDAFNRVLDDQVAQLKDQGITISRDELAAAIVGRKSDGSPLIPGGSSQNDFDYTSDPTGSKCPFASHVRRTNPRNFEHGRPAPRIVRRGMSFGTPYAKGEDPKTTPARGLIFMCYQSSIAEQYEVIQRWINGGNSTGISSGFVDPLLGVGPKASAQTFATNKAEPRQFQFEWQGRVARVELTEPFVSLNWGLYLFAPSRSGLAALSRQRSDNAIKRVVVDMPPPLENTGNDFFNRLNALPEAVIRKEVKRVLEDIDAKDPGELALTPDIWSAIRWYKGGATRLQKIEEFVLFPGATIELPRDVTMGNKSTMSQTRGGLLGGFRQKLRAKTAEIAANLKDAAQELFEGDQNASPKSAADAEIDERRRTTVLVATKSKVIEVLADWKTYSVEEQLSRIVQTSGSIYVTQQPDDDYTDAALKKLDFNYRKESLATNEILLEYTREMGFELGQAVGKSILLKARENAATVLTDPPLDYTKLELRRQYLMPALGMICSAWFGIPGPLSSKPKDDPDGLNQIMVNGGWDWHPANDGPNSRIPRCPGDCLSPSRGAFYPNPTDSITAYAHDHGPAIKEAGLKFVEKYWDDFKTKGKKPPGWVTKRMFAAMEDKESVSRNLIGIMVGAMPPMDGNLRGILVEWLNERTLWRHQAAYLREKASGKDPFNAAWDALYIPMSRAMCKRPAPDLIYRKALKDDTLVAYRPGPVDNNNDGKKDPVKVETKVKKGDRVIVSLVAAAQQSLMGNPDGPGDVSVIFGGNRRVEDGKKCPWQGEYIGEELEHPGFPVHACPAQDMAMGAMMGLLAALLEAGQIEALPASLIVKIKDLPKPAG